MSNDKHVTLSTEDATEIRQIIEQTSGISDERLEELLSVFPAPEPKDPHGPNPADELRTFADVSLSYPDRRQLRNVVNDIANRVDALWLERNDPVGREHLQGQDRRAVVR